MSGGFFRGTSADQDTRFSNKQAKLLKTQKFAPELDHLVDMSKVKMDVMKPWIAKRVTELLGFEDEVLINFIYGLLEEKEADGKKIQIQLTGFMEKNTVKFMKELWSLLLSAQQNASGVPQQFLDAKEAEIQQRKAEDDRIAQEIQKKREKDGRDSELEKHRMMDGDAGNSRSYGDSVGSALNNANLNAEEEKELDFKRSSRTKNRRGRRRSISPHNSKSPNRARRSLSRDIEKGTNGASANKGRVVLERNQERRPDDGRDGGRMGDRHSPDSEQRRPSKYLGSPKNTERNTTRDSSSKSSGKHFPSKYTTDTDEDEGSRVRENARKANSARRKTKDSLPDLELKKVHADDSSPGEKSPLLSEQSDKGIEKKGPSQLSESSDDELAGRRMKHQTDSPSDSRGKQHSPVRIEKDNSRSHIDSGSSGSEEPEKHRSHSGKRRHKKAHKHKKHYDDSSESDSEPDDKEAKKRRKEEKRLRKEERRRRREERHRRREERHASKQKSKHIDTDQDSDSDVDVRKEVSYAGREESDQKKLEIELREKALESLRAKKAINH
ncbi:hypothetical protein ACP70R_012605 [Stipagrostis hirtigluma subsp. patula]